MNMELRRVIFDEQMRSEKRKSAGTAIESGITGKLKPWREVVTPHKDVASGRYQQAEFAADLWQVQPPTAYELMKGGRGIVDSGIGDLATNPKYMKGFGRASRRHR